MPENREIVRRQTLAMQESAATAQATPGLAKHFKGFLDRYSIESSTTDRLELEKTWSKRDARSAQINALMQHMLESSKGSEEKEELCLRTLESTISRQIRQVEGPIAHVPYALDVNALGYENLLIPGEVYAAPALPVRRVDSHTFANKRSTLMKAQLPMKQEAMRTNNVPKPETIDRLAIHHGSDFVAYPSSIHFHDYKPHITYTIPLELRNVSGTSSRVRILSPKSLHFALLGLDGSALPENEGIIAAGLHRKLLVQFSPDTLSDFSTEIVIECGSGKHSYLDDNAVCTWTSFKVQVNAKNKRPQLNIPAEGIDVGYCQVGDTSSISFLLKNSGEGAARFRILAVKGPEAPFSNRYSRWNEKEVNADVVTAECFQISPAFFTLKPGETLPIKVRFSTLKQKELQLARSTSMRRITRSEGNLAGGFVYSAPVEHLSMFKLQSDNCFESSFTVKGVAEMPKIIFTSGTWSKFQLTGTVTATGAGFAASESEHNYHFEFGSFSVNSISDKVLKVTIKNQCHLDLDFYWKIQEPEKTLEASKRVRIADMSGASTMSLPEAKDIDRVFSVHPSSGFLPAAEETSFYFTFSPCQARKYLHNAVIRIDNRNYGTIRLTGEATEPELYIYPNLLRTQAPLQLGETTSLSTTIVNSSPLPVEFKASVDGSRTWAQNGVDISLNMTSTVLHGKAERKLNINLLLNDITQDLAGDNCCVTVTILMTHKFALPAQYLRSEKWCAGKGFGKRYAVRVYFSVERPTLQLSVPRLDFGLLRLHEDATQNSKSMEFTIRNLASVPIALIPGSDRPELMICDHSLVSIPSKQTTAVRVQLHYDTLGKQKAVVKLYYRDRKGQPTLTCATIPVRWTALRPLVGVSPTSCGRISGFVHTPIFYRITLSNLSYLPAAFQWEDVRDAEGLVFRFHPQAGQLAGGENLEANVEIISSKPGTFTDRILKCTVNGMLEDGYDYTCATIEAMEVKPLALTLSLEQGGPEFVNATLSFGDSVPIFADAMRRVFLTNNTGVRAEFSISFARFGVKEPEKQCPPHDTVQSKTLLGKTVESLLDQENQPTVYGFKSSAGYDYAMEKIRREEHAERKQQALSSKSGLAFVSDITKGFLAPYSSVELNITAFNDIAGSYHDELIVQAQAVVTNANADLDLCQQEYRVPLAISVVGTPLVIRKRVEGLVVDHSGTRLHAVLSFGQHLIGRSPVVKVLRLENVSSADAEVDFSLTSVPAGIVELNPLKFSMKPGFHQDLTITLFCDKLAAVEKDELSILAAVKCNLVDLEVVAHTYQSTLELSGLHDGAIRMKLPSPIFSRSDLSLPPIGPAGHSRKASIRRSSIREPIRSRRASKQYSTSEKQALSTTLPWTEETSESKRLLLRNGSGVDVHVTVTTSEPFILTYLGKMGVKELTVLSEETIPVDLLLLKLDPKRMPISLESTAGRVQVRGTLTITHTAGGRKQHVPLLATMLYPSISAWVPGHFVPAKQLAIDFGTARSISGEVTKHRRFLDVILVNTSEVIAEWEAKIVSVETHEASDDSFFPALRSAEEKSSFGLAKMSGKIPPRTLRTLDVSTENHELLQVWFQPAENLSYRCRIEVRLLNGKTGTSQESEGDREREYVTIVARGAGTYDESITALELLHN